MIAPLPIPRARRFGPPHAKAKRPEDRVNSYFFIDSELRRSTAEAVCEVRGVASLSVGRVGDLARSFFGQVQR